MAGAGLIWSGVGKGIADAGNTMANIGIREYERRDAARLRSDEREEARADRAELEQDRREWQAGQNEIYRRTAAQQNAGKGGGGMKGVDPADLEPGGRLAHLIAGEAGMTAPDYAKQINAMKTGDMSGFEVEQDVPVAMDHSIKQKGLPKGFEDQFKAKAKMLSQLAMTYVTGSEAKGIAEAKQIGLITNAAEGVLSGTGDVTRAYQAGGIVKGNDRYKEGGGVVVETATGTNKATPVGESQIVENKAQAEKYRAEIPNLQAELIKIQAETKEVGKDKQPSAERLGQIMNSAKDWLKLLDEVPKDENYKSDKAKAQKLLRDTTALLQAGVTARAAPAAEKPADKNEPAAKLSALPAGATYLGMSKGKKVYSLPDGSRYVEK